MAQASNSHSPFQGCSTTPGSVQLPPVNRSVHSRAFRLTMKKLMFISRNSLHERYR